MTIFLRLTWHVWGTDPGPHPPAKVPPSKSVTPPSPKLFYPPPPSPQTFYSPLPLEMAASAFFTQGYFQKAHVHISEAIIID